METKAVKTSRAIAQPQIKSPTPPSTPTSSNSSTATVQYHQHLNQSNSVTAFIRKCFKFLGEAVAVQPWEAVVITLVILCGSLVILSRNNDAAAKINDALHDTCSKTAECVNAEKKKEWVLVLTNTGFSCLSILHLMYRFKKIKSIGSSLILQITGIYLTASYILFGIVLWTAGSAQMKFTDAWFMIPLLTDFQKVTRMAQFALSSSHRKRISENVANGMYVLAPTMSMDSVVKILLFTLGWQIGIAEFVTFAWYAVVSVIVNMLLFLIFYPAGLSIVLEMMCIKERPSWDVRQIINTLPAEEGQSPVVHRVKVLVTALISIFHIICMPNFFTSSDNLFNLEKLTIVASMLILLIRYFYYEDMDEAKELRQTYIKELTKKYAEDSEQKQNKEDMDRQSNSTDEGISIDSNSNKQRPTGSGAGDDSGSESAWSEVGFLPEFKDQEVQTVEQELSMVTLKLESDSEEEDSEEKDDESVESSTDEEDDVSHGIEIKVTPAPATRSLENCKAIFDEGEEGASSLTDAELVQLVESKVIRAHALEKVLESKKKGVQIRRKYIEKQTNVKLKGLPYANYDYESIMGACCESVIGYMTVPVGVAGPLNLDGELFHVPMATTEGCLVASVNRGCNALRHCGVTSVVTGDGMTRGPIVRFSNIVKMNEARSWIEQPDNYKQIKLVFDGTSRFARLQKITMKPAGRELYIRFCARTGDAMGMNMLSKATEKALTFMKDEVFPDMQILSLSGNFCTDKKPAAVNWLEGRGKSVVCEAIVPYHVVNSTLKTTPEALVDLNRSKNLVGSAIAGSIGGFNAQAANVVTAIFIATGQDAAQNVASSNCLTQMDVLDGDLYITVTMPSIEVGTVGGGTILKAQGACLNLLGVKGSHPTSQGMNATQLARIVCATVLAGELSLMSALAAGHLVRSHLRHNRSQLAVTSCSFIEPQVMPHLGAKPPPHSKSQPAFSTLPPEDDDEEVEREKRLR